MLVSLLVSCIKKVDLWLATPAVVGARWVRMYWQFYMSRISRLILPSRQVDLSIKLQHLNEYRARVKELCVRHFNLGEGNQPIPLMNAYAWVVLTVVGLFKPSTYVTPSYISHTHAPQEDEVDINMDDEF